jgi:glycosyltransferase involved in cell wall biosynthesis
MAGEGPLRSELEDLAARLGIARAVTFSGRIDNADITALYRSASVFLNPSRVDNMPNSVLEALATGVPVVSTNVGGVPFMVEDGHTALLVPPGDADAMAAAMLRLTSDAELRGRLSCQGRELVRKYDWSRIRPQLIALYARLARSELTAGTRTT